MRFLKALSLALSICQIRGLHLYMRNGDIKCFYENLAQDSVLNAKFDSVPQAGTIDPNETVDINLVTTVYETFDNDHKALSQQIRSKGDFTFTALESGEHKICIASDISEPKCTIKVELELDISVLHLPDVEIVQQARDANVRLRRLAGRLEVLRNEQRATKAREKNALVLSQRAQSKVLFWCALQSFILVGTLYIQLRWLKDVSRRKLN
ncbi:LANO_0H22584g1_1 [Lachancea nothofagi CBS 11611]|uniref:LANO_0H22584g1_1 n=1 Tax=Lachancea nothofagi CBS 11611 TaxID=1266666 RepID=A0A1G4KNR9_9SACH|nr:LANO_0H22584g1_1 [Lachancea nothofagi CBS 11611]